MRGKRACVIGAGFGGLALAIRLQAAGVETVLVEGRDKPGGCAYAWEREGFTFDAGPGAITDPEALRALWALSGHDMADDVELLPVSPFMRFSWPDGSQFDLGADQAAMAREVARIAPDDLAGFEEYQLECQELWREGQLRPGQLAAGSLRELGMAAPALLRHQGWRSLHSLAASCVRDAHLREALAARALLLGGNPFAASSILAAHHEIEQASGVWCVKGGTGRLVAALAGHFERLGGTLRLHDPAVRIHTIGNRVSEVETQSGWRERFDGVASNADLVHTYRELLGEVQRGPEMARSLARKRWSPSLFMVHFGLEGSWPGIPHHSMLMGPRFRGLMDDVFEHGVLPADMLIYLHHPSVTDPGLAPSGKSTFYAMLPVAHRGKLPIDWEAIGPMLERRVLDEVGRRLIPDIHDRIVTSFHYTPRDFALDLGAYNGSAFGLEPCLSQSGWLRPHQRDAKLRNFYLVGAGTPQGAGIPAVLGSARIAARLMLEELR
jgi:phytoene desaturase